MTLLVDTTVLIDVLRWKKDRPRLLRDFAVGGATVGVSAVSVTEVYAGMRRGEEEATEALFSGFVCYPVTFEIARRAGKLKYEHARKGRTLGFADMLVAATALEHHLDLVTDNRKDFVIQGLNLLEF